ncbi:hypothetical protein ABKN59_004544 [Abortiporus biennis]
MLRPSVRISSVIPNVYLPSALTMIPSKAVGLLLFLIFFVPWIGITASPIVDTVTTAVIPFDSYGETAKIIDDHQANGIFGLSSVDSELIDDDGASDMLDYVEEAVTGDPLKSGLGAWIHDIIDRTEGQLPADFLERAHSPSIQWLDHAGEILKREVLLTEEEMQSIQGIQKTTKEVVQACSMLRNLMINGEEAVDASTVNAVSQDLEKQIQPVLNNIKDSSPPTDHALSHEDRQQTVDHILDEVGVIIIQVFCHGILRLDEEDVTKIWTVIKFGLSEVLVTTGDLVEQHPEIFFLVIGLILEEWILARSLLRLFGWGPLGPIKGSLAAFLQSRIFGASIPKGTWFAVLQRLGQLHPIRKMAGLWKEVVGSAKSLFG